MRQKQLFFRNYAYKHGYGCTHGLYSQPYSLETMPISMGVRMKINIGWKRDRFGFI